VKVSARAVEGAGDVSVRGDDLSQLVALDQTNVRVVEGTVQ